MNQYDVILIGGGLAGLTAAIHLAKNRLSVLVLERHTYPKHKVCGEYVSNEVKPYLAELGLDFEALNLPQIDQFIITTDKSKIDGNLPLGGFGISRYAFDDLLYHKAKSFGASFVFEKVETINFENNNYSITTKKQSFSAKLVIGSFGKRSNLDLDFNRNFTKKQAPWVGIKAHYKHPNFLSNQVQLHNFEGGYCGLSLTEDQKVNVCYLAKYDVFKQYKNIEEFNQKVLCKNKYLAQFFDQAQIAFENHLAIAQVSFEDKQTVENEILMIGDAAGLIHPLCGNGMAMAIHSAKLVAEEVLHFQHHNSRKTLFDNYSKKWQVTFQKRMKFGRIFQSLLLNQSFTNIGIAIGSKIPFLVQKMIQQTHGKPIV